jgi:hypothetical protein
MKLIILSCRVVLSTKIENACDIIQQIASIYLLGARDWWE